MHYRFPYTLQLHTISQTSQKIHQTPRHSFNLEPYLKFQPPANEALRHAAEFAQSRIPLAEFLALQRRALRALPKLICPSARAHLTRVFNALLTRCRYTRTEQISEQIKRAVIQLATSYVRVGQPLPMPPAASSSSPSSST